MTTTEIPPLSEITARFTACEDCQLMPSELTADRVAECVSYLDHQEDEESISALLRLKDGRWCYWHIWADYTGHGCQCGQSAEIFDTESKARECWSLHSA